MDNVVTMFFPTTLAMHQPLVLVAVAVVIVVVSQRWKMMKGSTLTVELGKKDAQVRDACLVEHHNRYDKLGRLFEQDARITEFFAGTSRSPSLYGNQTQLRDSATRHFFFFHLFMSLRHLQMHVRTSLYSISYPSRMKLPPDFRTSSILASMKSLRCWRSSW